jgi:hypothetical protein
MADERERTEEDQEQDGKQEADSSSNGALSPC